MRFITAILCIFCFFAINAPEVLCDAVKKTENEDGKFLNRLPVYFIENNGQLNDEVHYYVLGSEQTIYFTRKGITFSIMGKNNSEASRWVVKLDFVDADPDVQIKGELPQKAIFNYFKGESEKWRTGINTFSSVVYEDLWSGIDLVYRGDVNQLKYSFIVQPGSDPARIRLRCRGTKDITINEKHGLTLNTPIGSIEDAPPCAFQNIDGENIPVPVHYTIEEDTCKGSSIVNFTLGSYDATRPLVIDPTLIVYCGYIGGLEYDDCAAVAVDGNGCAYITGCTESNENSFPVKVGPWKYYDDNRDAFVAKVKADGTELVYCGYIGGEEHDSGTAIAVDGSGNAYVTGQTASYQSSFPVKVGPCLYYAHGYADAFVAKVNAAGNDLVYCGYIGGSDSDTGKGIAVDEYGYAYVIGNTSSHHSTFPVRDGPGLQYKGQGDAFVAKVDDGGGYLVHCGYIGGTGVDSGAGIDVHNSTPYVTGYTGSNDLPVQTGPSLIIKGAVDAFVGKVNGSFTGYNYLGYLGGVNSDMGNGIAVDADGNAYVTGETESNHWSFPVMKGPDIHFNGGKDAFVTKINAQGNNLIYSGYIGGEDNDEGKGIALDEEGNAYITGMTWSDETSFPVVIGPDLSFNGGMYSVGDGFVAKVMTSGNGLIYCGYIGGTDDDTCLGIAIDSGSNAYVVGVTRSESVEGFPVKVGPDLSFNHGLRDGFVTKIEAVTLTADEYNLSASTGGVVTFSIKAGTGHANRNYLMFGNITGTSPGIPLPGGDATLPLNYDYFMELVFQNRNGPMFPNFEAVLDAQGNNPSSAPPQLIVNSFDPIMIGQVMHYAFALYSPWDFASNPVPVEIIP